MNTNINFPQAPFLDTLTQRPALPWLLWLQNPTIVSLNSSIGIPVTSGGTGLSTTPTNGQLLIGNGSGYSLNTLTAGKAISITNSAGAISLENKGVTSIIAGSGISVSSTTGDVTVTALATTYASSYQTAVQNQTVFTIPTYVVGNNSLKVYVNGSKQINTLNYNETNTTTITFVSGLNVGDIVEFTK